MLQIKKYFIYPILFTSVILSTSKFLSVPNENDIDWNEWESLELSDRQSMSQSCKCGAGLPKLNTTKIVGGVTSRNHGWPWMGAIVDTRVNPPSAVCGGSLINNWYLLTAAHCAVYIKGVGLSNFSIYLGSNRINGKTNITDRVILSIGEVKIFPKYSSSSKTNNFDVAVLRFSTAVNFTKTINPICLSQAGEPFVNRDAIVAGWGVTASGSQNASNELRETNLNVISNNQCNHTYGIIAPQMLCAYAPNKDSCQGDSGGPLITKKSKGTKPDIYTQIGIVSFGQGCGQIGFPGVYARVSKFINWIKASTKGAIYCSDSFGTTCTCPNTA